MIAARVLLVIALAMVVRELWGLVDPRRSWRHRRRDLIARRPGHHDREVVAVVLVAGAETIGRRLRRLAGRPPQPARDRVVGVGTVVGVAALLVLGVVPAAAALVITWAAPIIRARARRRRREARVLDEVPEVVDLVRLAIGAGLNVRLALHAVAQHGDGLIVDELRRVDVRIERGDRVADVLADLASHDVLGEPVRPLLDALLATERYGAPIGPSLERVADEARLRRRRHHEAQARKLPVRLLFPLVCCTLPALILLTVVPALARSLPSFGH